MCPCTVLGAASQDLPVEVSREVKGFFKMCLDKLIAAGLSASGAAGFLSTITGALVVANALGDTGAYDQATSDLMRLHEAPPCSARWTSSGSVASNSQRCCNAGFINPLDVVPRVIVFSRCKPS